MLTQQIQAELVVMLLVLLSVAAGTVVATVTARRLAEPLSGVADRAARLGAGDFRSAPAQARHPRARSSLRRARHLRRRALRAGPARAGAGGRRLPPAAQPDHRPAAAARRARRPTPIPTLAARRWPRSSRPRSSRRCSTTCWRPHAPRAPLAPSCWTCGRCWRPSSTSGGRTLRAEGRSLKVRLPDGLLARVTPARIREAVGALVDNALRHGGGAVRSRRGARHQPGHRGCRQRRRGAGGPGAARLRPRRVRRFVHRAGAGAGPRAHRGRRRAAGALPGAARRCSRSSCPPRGPTTWWARPGPRAARARGPARTVSWPRAPGGARSCAGTRTAGTPTSGTPCRRACRRSGRSRNRRPPA